MTFSKTATSTATGTGTPLLNQVILQDRQGSRWLRFSNPRTIITTNDHDQLLQQLNIIDRLVNEEGLYAAGFIAYEAAPAFDKALVVGQKTDLPLIWFGIYDSPEEISAPAASASYELGSWQPSISKAQYNQAFSRIKELIAAGRTYQVNYTLRLRAPFSGSPWALFQDLVQAQDSAYAAYLDLGYLAICSASPELFFELEGTQLKGKPMKGTAPRGRTLTEDNELADWLYHSEKNRAENVMIVDMIRNDIGRVSEIGSVTVPRLFEVERYPTLLQMTSSVTGSSRKSIPDILTALFPCASITGAPKVSTMQIIAALEPDPRGIYTGSIGYIAPGRKAQFNVAIRTVVVDRRSDVAEYGVGGGIVWGSNMEGEFEECQTKARILTERRPSFQLLESILWTPETGFFLLEKHLNRLSDSAQYFDFNMDHFKVRKELERFGHELRDRPQKVRLLLHRDGTLFIEALPGPPATPAEVVLAAESIDERDVFLYHKTTRRAIYEHAREARPGFDDVILWNRQGEITESLSANVVVRVRGEMITPPVTCGLLGGTFRADLLARKVIREEVVTIKDLEHSEELFLINSVRKWRKARLVPQATSSSES